MTKEEELLALGFEKCTVYDEPRLSEIVEMYEEMGFEVRLEEVDLDNEPGCTECLKMNPANFKVVYKRKKENT